MVSELAQNPFSVQTPESISAEEVLSLFVQDFADFHQILRVGHTFLHGARGSGKSMIFRFLEPDCQTRQHKCGTKELEFFSFYVPIKETDLRITELARLAEQRHGSLTLNEHLMVVNIAAKVVEALKRAPIPDDGESAAAMQRFILGPMTKFLRRGGWKHAIDISQTELTFDKMREAAADILDDVYSEVSQYVQRLFPGQDITYTGTLLGFFDFLRPFILALRELPFMPAGPIFLLIDDADNLSPEQTKILNTWVSSRGSAQLSLKISTQRRYKTYRTIAGQTIDTPHDFAEVEISDVYTSEKDRYLKRVRSIVEKRLQRANINVAPRDFFPPDIEQEAKIRAIEENIKAAWDTSGRGARARDDSYRYARPDFISSLQGTSKSGSSYSYSGFDQLVHLSSGVVRFFLEPAALMFGEQKADNEGQPVTSIKPHIQDKVSRSEADNFLTKEFERITRNEEDDQYGIKDKATKLRNLIDSLGALFHEILLSDASERRVFSVAFSNGPDDEVGRIFELGANYNYFHTSTIGKKEGAGRTALYVLSRRLAPVFTLDPTSFAGYKFITNDAARMMIFEPRRFHNQLRTRPLDQIVDPLQGRLFDEALP